MINLSVLNKIINEVSLSGDSKDRVSFIGDSEKCQICIAELYKLITRRPLYDGYLSKIIDEGGGKGDITREMREFILERDRKRCQICNHKSVLIHRIDPNGGATKENLLVLCSTCHEYVHKILRRNGGV